MKYLFALLTLLVLPWTAEANPACGQPLSGSWVLTGDLDCSAWLTHGLSLQSFAALNCQGFRIIGPDLAQSNGTVTGRYGLRIDDVEHVTVQNCDVKGYEIGIRVTDSQAITILNTVGRKNTRYGFDVRGATTSQVLISGGMAVSNGDEGLHASGPFAGENIFEGLYVSGNWEEGVYFLRCNHCILRNSTVVTNSAHPTASHPEINLDETTDAYIGNVKTSGMVRTVASPQESLSLCASSVVGGCQ